MCESSFESREDDSMLLKGLPVRGYDVPDRIVVEGELNRDFVSGLCVRTRDSCQEHGHCGGRLSLTRDLTVEWKIIAGVGTK